MTTFPITSEIEYIHESNQSPTMKDVYNADNNTIVFNISQADVSGKQKSLIITPDALKKLQQRILSKYPSKRRTKIFHEHILSNEIVLGQTKANKIEDYITTHEPQCLLCNSSLTNKKHALITYIKSPQILKTQTSLFKPSLIFHTECYDRFPEFVEHLWEVHSDDILTTSF